MSFEKKYLKIKYPLKGGGNFELSSGINLEQILGYLEVIPIIFNKDDNEIKVVECDIKLMNQFFEIINKHGYEIYDGFKLITKEYFMTNYYGNTIYESKKFQIKQEEIIDLDESLDPHYQEPNKYRLDVDYCRVTCNGIKIKTVFDTGNAISTMIHRSFVDACGLTVKNIMASTKTIINFNLLMDDIHRHDLTIPSVYTGQVDYTNSSEERVLAIRNTQYEPTSINYLIEQLDSVGIPIIYSSGTPLSTHLSELNKKLVIVDGRTEVSYPLTLFRYLGIKCHLGFSENNYMLNTYETVIKIKIPREDNDVDLHFKLTAIICTGDKYINVSNTAIIRLGQRGFLVGSTKIGREIHQQYNMLNKQI